MRGSFAESWKVNGERQTKVYRYFISIFVCLLFYTAEFHISVNDKLHEESQKDIFLKSVLTKFFFLFFCYIWMFQRRLIFSTTRRLIFLNCFDSQLLFHFTILVSTPLVSLLNQITGSPCQQKWKFLENGVEMIYTDNRRWMVMDG